MKQFIVTVTDQDNVKKYVHDGEWGCELYPKFMGAKTFKSFDEALLFVDVDDYFNKPIVYSDGTVAPPRALWIGLDINSLRRHGVGKVQIESFELAVEMTRCVSASLK